MTGEAYRIIKWWDRHSNYDQRRLCGRAILVPTSQDSIGFRRLMATAAGVQAFGIYVAISEIAGKLPAALPDSADENAAGVLFNDQGPISDEDIALAIGAPAKVVSAAMRMLMDAKIGWVDRVPLPRGSTSTSRKDDVNPTSNEREIHGSRPGVRKPARFKNTEASQPAGNAGADAGARVSPAMLSAWESRAGRKATVSEESSLFQMLDRLESSPVVVDGQQADPEQVLVAAINQLRPDVTLPLRYVATVIEQSRADHVMPGSAKASMGNGGGPRKFQPALTDEQVKSMEALER